MNTNKSPLEDDRSRISPLFLRCERLVRFRGLVGTVAGNMAGLLAPVANFGLSGLITVAADMSQATTVVAFLTLGAVLCHMTESTTGITSLAAVVISSITTEVSSFIIHGTVAGNMSNFAAFVAVSSSATGAGARRALLLGTLPGEMSGFSTAIASLALRRFGTITRKMSGLIAVVADLAAFGTIAGLMTRFTAIVTSSTHTATEAST